MSNITSFSGAKCVGMDTFFDIVLPILLSVIIQLLLCHLAASDYVVHTAKIEPLTAIIIWIIRFGRSLGCTMAILLLQENFEETIYNKIWFFFSEHQAIKADSHMIFCAML